MPPTADSPPRHRVLYIRHKRRTDLSDAFRINQDEWVEALSLRTDVTTISEDFDLDEVGNRVRPDFILYESPFLHAAPLAIKNPRAHPRIPRFGFLTQDPICPIRVPFLRMLEELNAHWIFTHLPEAVMRQSPEFKTRVVSISMLFDASVFHDYGLPKDIPVSVFGGFLSPEIYHWRAEMAQALTDRFPTLIYTHPGYNNPIPRHKFAVSGAAYARLLNRSYFSLADSTRLDYPVRKHLEIPASGAVLVAPATPALEPYGFRDMENCILGEGTALLDKIAAVAEDPALYQKIRKQGHDLVHARFERKNWRSILDFYEAYKNLQPGQTLQQQGILGTFKPVPAGDAALPAIAFDETDSDVSLLFKKWLRHFLENGDFPDIPGWMAHMEESFALTGVGVLLKGDLPQARDLFLAPHETRKNGAGFAAYDPEEIAWLSLIASLTSDRDLLALTRRQSAGRRHLSLRRMQWLGKILAAGGDASNPPADVLRRTRDDQSSIHWTGQLEIDQWLKLIARILAANGQPGLLREI